MCYLPSKQTTQETCKGPYGFNSGWHNFRPNNSKFSWSSSDYTQTKLSYSDHQRFIYPMVEFNPVPDFPVETCARDILNGFISRCHISRWYSLVLTLWSRKELRIRPFSRTLQNVRNPKNLNDSFPPLWKWNGGKKQLNHACNDPISPKKSSVELGCWPCTHQSCWGLLEGLSVPIFTVERGGAE